jgi:hypothetical protein
MPSPENFADIGGADLCAEADVNVGGTLAAPLGRFN